MFVRATLVIILAVVVAMSRPVATGGDHDLVAVGARVVVDGGGTSLVMSPPTDEARSAYRALLRSSAREELRMKHPAVVAHLPSEELGGDGEATLVSITFYGKGSRPGHAQIVFAGSTSAGSDEPLDAARPSIEVARRIAALAPSVSAAAARLVIAAGDVNATADAFEVLVRADPDRASSEAQRIALEPQMLDDVTATVRRIQAVRVLQSLGGAKVFPDAFAKLMKDRDTDVAATAARPAEK